MRPAAILFFAMLHAFAAGPRDAELEKAHEEFQTAWARFDVRALDRILADDMVWIGIAGNVSSKSSMLDAFRKKTMTSPMRESELRIRVYGDAAVVTTTQTNRDDEDPKLLLKILMTEVWVKKPNGPWQLVSFHGSAPPKTRFK